MNEAVTETVAENIEEDSLNIHHDEYQYSHAEEIANAISHGIGAFMSVAALTMMIMIADDGWKLGSAIVYGLSLVILFTSSTLYHSFQSPKVKRVFKTLDHCAIYLLIAGTYTPFLLVSLKGPWGWSLFGVIWFLAFAGILFKLKFKHRFPKASLMAYILMGWIVVVAIFEMLEKVPAGGLWLLLAGGLSYTFGTIFYAADGKIHFNHAIWHIFVLGGAICHFLAVYIFVL